MASHNHELTLLKFKVDSQEADLFALLGDLAERAPLNRNGGGDVEFEAGGLRVSCEIKTWPDLVTSFCTKEGKESKLTRQLRAVMRADVAALIIVGDFGASFGVNSQGYLLRYEGKKVKPLRVKFTSLAGYLRDFEHARPTNHIWHVPSLPVLADLLIAVRGWYQKKRHPGIERFSIAKDEYKNV